jgi:DNA-binding transcriptional regulator WhiA
MSEREKFDLKKLGRRIKRARREMGMTQARLAELIGVEVGHIGRLEKEMSNKVNRRCNCDDANTSKVVEAAQEQLNAIRILREKGILEQLAPKMQQAFIAREQNPAASLTELAAMMEPPITKPAMNHRLKKLVELSKEVTQ